MRKIKLTTLLLLTLAASVPVLASTATDFYLELLRRGTAEVEGGRYGTAVTPLRLAAFGLVDSIEHYETAQAYLAVALDKLGQQEEARRAALRVVTAEGIERKFATLRLPASIREAFGAVARKVLSSADAAALTSPPQTPAPRQNTPAVVPTTVPVVPQTTTPPRPAPEQETHVVPFDEQPKPVETSKPSPPPPDPIRAQPQSQKPAPAPVQARPQTPARVDPPKAVVTPVQVAPQPARVDVPSRIAAGERALAAANLTEARRIYRELLNVQTLDRASLIRIGEGLYRARDFAPALTAFRRLGTLRTGEEAYRYYIAIALYETADYAAAKRELAAALPHIEITPDVQRYRVKIEGAPN